MKSFRDDLEAARANRNADGYRELADEIAELLGDLQDVAYDVVGAWTGDQQLPKIGPAIHRLRTVMEGQGFVFYGPDGRLTVVR